MSPTATQNAAIQAHIQGLQFVGGIIAPAVGKDLTGDQLVFTNGTSTSNIAWLVGHITFSFDGLLGSALGLAPALAPEKLAQFQGGNGTPSTDIADYSSVEDSLAALATAVARAVEHIETLEDDVLAQPLPEGHPAAGRFPSIGVLLSAMVFHTGYHAGQITLLRRAQGLAPGIGAPPAE